MKYFILCSTVALSFLMHGATSVLSLKTLSTGKTAQAALEELFASKKPVLAKFYSTSCPPCKRMKPIFESLARLVTSHHIHGKEMDAPLHEKVTFLEIETGHYPSIAQQFDIFRNPTFVYFANGKEVDRIIGATSLGILRSKIEHHFKIKAH